ncbi:MAG: hypothetical protein JKY01_03690, partial [Pseudomonadales bacterium]|nr:hypothetical protein [Pseudomonadales bacterium]
RDAPLRQEKLNRAIKQLEKEKRNLRENKKKIIHAHRIMQRKLEPFQANIQDLLARIDSIQEEIKRINLEQKKRLQNLAIETLDRQQKDLDDFLIITELSIARLHESAALKARGQ